MDELLHAPEGEKFNSLVHGSNGSAREESGWKERLHRMAEWTMDRTVQVGRGAARALHWVQGAMSGGKPWGPAAFLATAGVLGVALVVGTVYTPSYVVSVDGVTLGTVREKETFEAVVDRVEERATEILGYDYTLDSEIGYEFALTEKDEISSVYGFETYLFDQIGEVMKSYALSVDGEFIGAVTDEAQLTAMLDEIKSQYVNENTISAEFVEPIDIVHEYTASNVVRDLSEMKEVLTANTTGETTYEVEAGDTFSAIAYAHDMSVDELEVLNPGLNINKLYVGQILTIRQTIPFLSVRTVENITYTEPIESPVEEIQDNTMYKGETKTVVKGTDGEALVNADVTYLNGYEEERVINSTTVITEPTKTVVHVGTKARPRTMATGNMIWPLSGTITSNYGYRYIFGSYSYHSGLDIAAAYGTSIKAADGGTVVYSGTGSGSYWSYGKYVVIDHGNGIQTISAHCSSMLVSTGDKVYQGQVIARVGATGRATGNHCHFQVKVNGTTVSPWNYLP